jgi:hypothetical protein
MIYSSGGSKIKFLKQKILNLSSKNNTFEIYLYKFIS